MFHPEILTGPPSGGVKQETGGENKLFLAPFVNISKSVRDTYIVRLLLMTRPNRKLHMRFRLATRLMTLDNLERVSSNLHGISRDFAYLG